VIGEACRSPEHPAKFPQASDFIESIELFVEEEWRSGSGRMSALTGSAAGVA
jgi:hypothetical protein